jgi:hypothetical protein
LEYQTSKEYHRKKRESDRQRKRNKPLIPQTNDSGTVADSVRNPSGFPALSEEKGSEGKGSEGKKPWVGYSQSNAPTPTPPRASKEELEIGKNPMPEEAKEIFQQLGYRR